MTTMTFSGEQIRRARGQLGWSRPDLMLRLFAAGLRISEPTIKNWEDGETPPGADDLGMLSRVLRKPIDFFYVPGT